jgi:hypothetical protein
MIHRIGENWPYGPNAIRLGNTGMGVAAQDAGLVLCQRIVLFQLVRRTAFGFVLQGANPNP